VQEGSDEQWEGNRGLETRVRVLKKNLFVYLLMLHSFAMCLPSCFYFYFLVASFATMLS
jgi:hypothetical protein